MELHESVSTNATGEEGEDGWGEPDPAGHESMTTLALGEEGEDSGFHPTTLLLGEEGEDVPSEEDPTDGPYWRDQPWDDDHDHDPEAELDLGDIKNCWDTDDLPDLL